MPVYAVMASSVENSRGSDSKTVTTFLRLGRFCGVVRIGRKTRLFSVGCLRLVTASPIDLFSALMRTVDKDGAAKCT